MSAVTPARMPDEVHPGAGDRRAFPRAWESKPAAPARPVRLPSAGAVSSRNGEEVHRSHQGPKRRQNSRQTSRRTGRFSIRTGSARILIPAAPRTPRPAVLRFRRLTSESLMCSKLGYYDPECARAARPHRRNLRVAHEQPVRVARGCGPAAARGRGMSRPVGRVLSPRASRRCGRRPSI